MALTNAERQERFRARQSAKAREGVTPEDVRRAVQMIYEASCREYGEAADFTGFVEKARKRGQEGLWRGMAPDALDPDDYPDSLTATDRAFLAKVAAVTRSVLSPPTD